MTPDPSRFQAEQLVSFTAAVLTGAGARADDADEVALHLVEANLTGHDSHGIGMLPAYIAHIKGEQVNIAAQDITRNDKGVIIQRDADAGWGKPAARRLIEAAIDTSIIWAASVPMVSRLRMQVSFRCTLSA
jgi:uncharacterized oxidoreductase